MSIHATFFMLEGPYQYCPYPEPDSPAPRQGRVYLCDAGMTGFVRLTVEAGKGEYTRVHLDRGHLAHLRDAIDGYLRATGAHRRTKRETLELYQKVPCEHCEGTGKEITVHSRHDCRHCHGTGSMFLAVEPRRPRAN